MGKVRRSKRSGVSSRKVEKIAAVKLNLKRRNGLKRGFSVTNMSKDTSPPSDASYTRSSDDSSGKEYPADDPHVDLLAKRFRNNFSSAVEKYSQSSNAESSADDIEENDDDDGDSNNENDDERESSEDGYKSCTTTPLVAKPSTPYRDASDAFIGSPKQSSLKMFNHHDVMFVVMSDFASAAFGGVGWMLVLQGTVGLYGVKVSASENLVLPVESVPGSCILFTNRGHQGQTANIAEGMESLMAGRSLTKAKELLARYPKKTIIAIRGRLASVRILKPNFSSADDSTPENCWNSLEFYVVPQPSMGVPNNRRFDDLVASVSKTAAREPVRLLLTGAKNSGKSSLIRAFCNRFILERIRKHSQQSEQPQPPDCPILVLDLDPGQTEFTPPGCVSLVEVTETLMGPPGSHPIKPEKSFLVGGGPTPGAHPDMYVKSVKLLMQHLHENAYETGYILLVNTMGWLTGIGELLLGSVVNIVQPTRVVSLDDEFRPQPSSAWPCQPLDIAKLSVTQLSLQGMFTKDPYSKSVTAAIHRGMSIIGYFGSDIMEKPPHAFPWFEVALHEVSGVAARQEILYLMNGNMVALCRVPERLILKSKSKPLFPKFLVSHRQRCEEPFECLGFGIVRCVDPVNKRIYVATPESMEVVHSVNALIYHSISLPAFFYVRQKAESLPYVEQHVTWGQSLTGMTSFAEESA